MEVFANVLAAPVWMQRRKKGETGKHLFAMNFQDGSTNHANCNRLAGMGANFTCCGCPEKKSRHLFQNTLCWKTMGFFSARAFRKHRPKGETSMAIDGVNQTRAGSRQSEATDHTAMKAPGSLRRRVWDHVSDSPLHSLWDLQGVPPMVIARRALSSFNEDNLLSRAAELGYYFLFALFPTLVSASAILGLAARSATDIYVKLLNYLSVVVPHAALGIVLETFNQTTAHSSGGKITFGVAAALWSASVGFTAIQDTLNTVYKVKETRPYWKVRGAAMLVTLLLSAIITLTLATMLGGDFSARYLEHHVSSAFLGFTLAVTLRGISWVVAAGLLILLFAVIYYFAPDVKNKNWHWLTPGGALGIGGWLLASVLLRVYLHYFDNYSVTYGSLGAVIILLTWFYVTGLMLLIGAEINSEIAAAVAEKKITGTTPSAEGPAGEVMASAA